MARIIFVMTKVHLAMLKIPGLCVTGSYSQTDDSQFGKLISYGVRFTDSEARNVASVLWVSSAYCQRDLIGMEVCNFRLQTLPKEGK